MHVEVFEGDVIGRGELVVGGISHVLLVLVVNALTESEFMSQRYDVSSTVVSVTYLHHTRVEQERRQVIVIEASHVLGIAAGTLHGQGYPCVDSADLVRLKGEVLALHTNGHEGLRERL